jgi:hypothetical protein
VAPSERRRYDAFTEPHRDEPLKTGGWIVGRVLLVVVLVIVALVVVGYLVSRRGGSRRR